MVNTIITILAIGGTISYLLFSWTLIYNKKPPSIDYYKLSFQGPPLFDELCSGKISTMVFPSSIRIQIFKSGILIKPAIMTNCLLNKEEISYFTTSFNGTYSGTEIVHTSPYLKSPLIINTTFSSELKDLFK